MTGNRHYDSMDEAQLRLELARVSRRLAHTERAARALEVLAEQSKRAMLRTNADLTQTIEDLREAKHKAEQATAAKGRFLAMMSHELRTPLHGVIGSADLLLEAHPTSEQQELINLIRRAGSSLLAIVNDVLEYSRIDAGSLQLEAVPFSLVECVREVIELQSGAIGGRPLRLRCELATDLPVMVKGDQGRVRQVLNNLVNNAIKFTAAGEVVVSVRPSGDDDMLEFAVTDTGVGIAETAVPQLFQAFMQEDTGTNRRFGGTGLGLAICKRLVQMMGGDITVDSAPGVGSKFAFTCRLPQSSTAKVEGSDRAATRDRFAGLRALIVDDNQANRVLMQRMLKRLGFAADEVDDGAKAVAVTAANDFALVLMDCNMPVMDGYAATAAIRQRGGAGATVPIVAVTANTLPDDRQRCFDVGMNAYLSKPVRLPTLEAELGRLLGR